MLEFEHTETSHKATFFVEVILPLSISKTYTYRVPFAFSEHIAIGKRVIVQFGKSRIYTGIINAISDQPPSLYEAKYVIDILDDEPIIHERQFQLWNWVASYYMCTPGEVMNSALPASLKLASETKVLLQQAAEYLKSELTDKEFLIVEALETEPELRISDISKLLGQKTVFPILKELLKKGIIHISEEVATRYKPRTRAFLSLKQRYTSETALKQLFAYLERSPKQVETLQVYFRLKKSRNAVSKKDMEEEGVSASALKALISKHVFEVEYQPVSRLHTDKDETFDNFVLSDSQRDAYEHLIQTFKDKDVALLHGVTSSGKTQIYVRMIEQALASSKQVLYLLPEIALTTQIIERLKRYFGSKIGVYHSRMGDNERAEVWIKVQKKEYQIILGARSAVFLPFCSLGLVVVDEEHESSYKQHDPAPRYHARDTAIYLAHIHQAKVLLGSATPSLESYFNAKNGKYGFAELACRFGASSLPGIQVVSIGEETNKKTLQYNFSSVLIKEIELRLQRQEQVILFQNRRGYTPLLMCNTCGYIPHCVHCDVSLTYHKSSGKLHCHYCGFRQDPLSDCPACGSTHIEQKGFGTERIEDDLQMLFPHARIARMDLDTTRTKNGFQKIVSDFEERVTDVLVGTQIVAKGLDFEHVTLIGIINADSLVNYPDFRAFERSFQLLSQVAGRAGRREKAGKVIIQAHAVQHRVITQVINNNYKGMFEQELAERRTFAYPPYVRMIRIDLKHKDKHVLHAVAMRFALELKDVLKERVLGPEDPLISRIRSYFIKTVYVKVERNGISLSKVKDFLKQTQLKFISDRANKNVFIQFDVDPY